MQKMTVTFVMIQDIFFNNCENGKIYIETVCFILIFINIPYNDQ